jgi:hypothetical protein
MVETFTTAYGIFKPMMKDVSDVEWAKVFSGGLAQTVAAFKTTGPQMAEAIKNVGATAAASLIPLEEQMAILGQLQTTMPGSEAGTLYKAFIMKAAEAGDELKLSFVDASGRLKGIIPILEELKSRFPDLSQAAAQVQIKKAFGSDEAVKFVLQMSQGMNELEGNIKGIAGAMKGGTAMTMEMARTMNMDIGSQLTLVKQQLSNLFEILGRTLLPIMIPIIQGVSRVIVFFQKLARAVPFLTGTVLTLSMALGAVLILIGAVVAATGTIGLMLPALEAGFAGIGTTLAGVGGVIAAWFWPVTLAIGGVILSVYLLKRAWESNFGGIRDTVMGFWNNVKLVFEGIRALTSSLSDGAGQMSAELAQKLQRAGQAAKADPGLAQALQQAGQDLAVGDVTAAGADLSAAAQVVAGAQTQANTAAAVTDAVGQLSAAGDAVAAAAAGQGQGQGVAQGQQNFGRAGQQHQRHLAAGGHLRYDLPGLRFGRGKAAGRHIRRLHGAGGVQEDHRIPRRHRLHGGKRMRRRENQGRRRQQLDEQQQADPQPLPEGVGLPVQQHGAPEPGAGDFPLPTLQFQKV